MSNFKIQIFNQSSQLQIKKVTLPSIPKISIAIESIPLLNYPLEQLVQIVSSYFSQMPPDKLYIIKTLKILAHSLGDKNLMSKLQSIISGKIEQQYKMYHFLILWTSVCTNFYKLLNKFSDRIRKQLVNIIFCYFLLQNNYGEGHLKVQLGQLLKLESKQNILNNLKKKYKSLNEPLKLCIQKCWSIKSENIQLIKLSKEWMQFCINSNEEKVLQLIKDKNSEELNYLIENIPNMRVILIKQLKTVINQQNIRDFRSENVKINVIYQSAIKEWINDDHNYWKLVNKYVNDRSSEYFQETIKLGKELNQQNLQHQLITIQFFHSYLQGNRFNFAHEHNQLNPYQKETWMDIYRGITLMNSYNRMNLLIVNINTSIKWWDQVNPFKTKSKNDKLNKFIDKHKDFFKEKEKEYVDKNKKLQIVYNTFLIQNKQNKTELILSYEQLNLYIDNKLDLNSLTFKKMYTPYKMQVKEIKEQNKKEHNVIIEAKMVKLLKKHKESLTFQFLSKESGYTIEVIQLGMKRLISKGLAQQDEKGKGYNYMP